MLIREFIFIPYMLDIAQKNIDDLSRQTMTLKPLFVKAAEKLMDNLTRRLGEVRKELRRSQIKVWESRHGRPNISVIIRLGAGLGLRIHEVTRLSHMDAIASIRNGHLHVKGKNGLERDVILRGDMAELLKATAAGVNKDPKLFIPNGRKTHEVIQSVQDFIGNHRDKVARPDVRTHGARMTFHGLRHRYAFDRYQEFRKAGFTAAAARLMVSKLLGHSRDDITRIYLADTDEEAVK